MAVLQAQQRVKTTPELVEAVGKFAATRRSNGAGMSAKEKTKPGAPASRSKESDAKGNRAPKRNRALGKGCRGIAATGRERDADAELGRIREQVAELRREFYTHLGPGRPRRSRVTSSVVHAGFYRFAVYGILLSCTETGGTLTTRRIDRVRIGGQLRRVHQRSAS